MDRRTFLKTAAAVPAMAYLPAAEARPVLDVAAIKRVVSGMGIMQGVDSPWVCIVHPSQEQDLRDLAAREQWKGAYADWRKAGKPPMTCREIIDKYRPEVDLTSYTCAEVGSFEGFRFITQERLTL